MLLSDSLVEEEMRCGTNEMISIVWCAKECRYTVHIHNTTPRFDGLILRSAAFFATISASYTIEQHGLPRITRPSSDVLSEEWNGDTPWRRLLELKARHAKKDRN